VHDVASSAPCAWSNFDIFARRGGVDERLAAVPHAFEVEFDGHPDELDGFFPLLNAATPPGRSGTNAL
jgi:hypothetical protein